MIDWDAPIDHWVYVHLTANWEALYVGMTANPKARLAQHRSKSPWYEDIRHVRMIGPLPNRYVASDVEVLAIAAYKPQHNLGRAQAFAARRT